MRAFEKRKLDNHPSSTFFDPKIQKKLKTGKAGDQYEVEADTVANKVVNTANKTGGLMQAKEEEQLQQKPIADSSSTLQKQEIKEEPVQKQEEEKLQKKEEEEVQKKEEEEQVQAKDEEELQQKPITETISTLQKQETKEEEPIQRKEEKKESESETTESKIKKTKGEGHPMSKDIQSEMDTAFKADFSPVRIHTDSAAIALCQEMGAQAFTNGVDIYFNKGKYNPQSKAGKELLAHELTHTIQQGAIDKM